MKKSDWLGLVWSLVAFWFLVTVMWLDHHILVKYPAWLIFLGVLYTVMKGLEDNESR